MLPQISKTLSGTASLQNSEHFLRCLLRKTQFELLQNHEDHQQL
jgi:hypothetical protein